MLLLCLARLTQSVEWQALNLLVAGSSPASGFFFFPSSFFLFFPFFSFFFFFFFFLFFFFFFFFFAFFFFPKPPNTKNTRRRWNRTTGTLIPHGFEIQALNPQSSSTQNDVPGVRIELTTFGLWDQRSTNWANPAIYDTVILWGCSSNGRAHA